MADQTTTPAADAQAAGRSVLVTGGNRGIGLAIAEAFLAACEADGPVVADDRLAGEQAPQEIGIGHGTPVGQACARGRTPRAYQAFLQRVQRLRRITLPIE